ncbi:RHS repeat protein, partial [Viscerimonas tarda]
MIIITEGFTYDNLDRLTTVTYNGASVMNITYQTNGNIESKTGVGQYAYLSPKPHALTWIENNGGTDPAYGQNITYTNFNKIATISENRGYNGTCNLSIAYDPMQNRRQSTVSGNGYTKTTAYYGDYETVTGDGGGLRHLYYISGGDGLAAVIVRYSASNIKVYYVHKDHLGSIIKLTESNGTEVFKASYDAWGRQTVTNNTFKFYRGYTGHEHLPEFSLINMNGRVYDPVLGRFLSPDPYVQMPDFSQNFNRYSYCF